MEQETLFNILTGQYGAMTNLINVRVYVAQASGYWGESLSSLIDDLQNYFSL